MSKTIEIKKATIRNLFLSFILGFAVLFGLEHFGTFKYILVRTSFEGRPTFEQQVPATTKVSTIEYHTFFKNLFTTDGNGFDAYDLNYSGTEFNTYATKSYYYTQAVIKDFIYGIYISLGIFILSILFSTFKIKLI